MVVKAVRRRRGFRPYSSASCPIKGNPIILKIPPTCTWPKDDQSNCAADGTVAMSRKMGLRPKQDAQNQRWSTLESKEEERNREIDEPSSTCTYRGLQAGEVDGLRARRSAGVGGAEHSGELVDERRHGHRLGDQVQHQSHNQVQHRRPHHLASKSSHLLSDPSTQIRSVSSWLLPFCSLQAGSGQHRLSDASTSYQAPSVFTLE